MSCERESLSGEFTVNNLWEDIEYHITGTLIYKINECHLDNCPSIMLFRNFIKYVTIARGVDPNFVMRCGKFLNWLLMPFSKGGVVRTEADHLFIRHYPDRVQIWTWVNDLVVAMIGSITLNQAREIRSKHARDIKLFAHLYLLCWNCDDPIAMLNIFSTFYRDIDRLSETTNNGDPRIPNNKSYYKELLKLIIGNLGAVMGFDVKHVCMRRMMASADISVEDISVADISSTDIKKRKKISSSDSMPKTHTADYMSGTYTADYMSQTYNPTLPTVDDLSNSPITPKLPVVQTTGFLEIGGIRFDMIPQKTLGKMFMLAASSEGEITGEVNINGVRLKVTGIHNGEIIMQANSV